MFLGWTAPARGLKPPKAILALYWPTDYASGWWTKPHFPWRTSPAGAKRRYDLWHAARDTPITGYNVAGARARIPLHMRWTAQTPPILLGAPSSEQKAQRHKHDGRPAQRGHETTESDGSSQTPRPMAAPQQPQTPPIPGARANRRHQPFCSDRGGGLPHAYISHPRHRRRFHPVAADAVDVRRAGQAGRASRDFGREEGRAYV